MKYVLMKGCCKIKDMIGQLTLLTCTFILCCSPLHTCIIYVDLEQEDPSFLKPTRSACTAKSSPRTPFIITILPEGGSLPRVSQLKDCTPLPSCIYVSTTRQTSSGRCSFSQTYSLAQIGVGKPTQRLHFFI